MPIGLWIKIGFLLKFENTSHSLISIPFIFPKYLETVRNVALGYARNQNMLLKQDLKFHLSNDAVGDLCMSYR